MSTPPLNDLVGLVVGAGRGIGAATARRLAADGAAVVLAARDHQAVSALSNDIEASGGRALPVTADTTVESSLHELVEQTVSHFGRLDLAVNTAGQDPPMGPLADLAPDAFDQAIDVFLRGVFLAMRQEIPPMLRSGHGAIVNVASTAGLQAAAGLGAYVAAKFGVVGLTQTAALDYAEAGIRINALAPGPIRVGRLAQSGDDIQRMAGQAMPMHRIGGPDEVAAAASWLCSPAAGYVTGVTLPVDGGKLAGSPPRPAPHQAARPA